MARKEEYADLKVGDGLWCTNPRWRNSDPENPLMEIVITKIGRKYMTCHRRGDEAYRYSGLEFDMETGSEKGDSNYLKRLVLSPYQYERDRTRDRLWDKFRAKVREGWGPTKAEPEDIIRAAQLLNIDLELTK
jgi:hypothetical protein